MMMVEIKGNRVRLVMMAVRVERERKRSRPVRQKKEKKTTDNVDAVPVSVSRRTTRGNRIYDTSGSGKIPKNLVSHLTAGAGEEQGAKLINPGLCDIEGCKVKTSVPVKCESSYDSTMSYADRCRNVCHCDCAREADLISDLDDALFYCSDKCKNKGDKYRNEELQNDTPKRNNKLHSSNTENKINRRRDSSKHEDDPDFTTSSSEIRSASLAQSQ